MEKFTHSRSLNNLLFRLIILIIIRIIIFSNYYYSNYVILLIHMYTFITSTFIIQLKIILLKINF